MKNDVLGAVKELLKIKRERGKEGEEEYIQAVQEVAQRFMGSPEGEAALRTLLPDFDFDAIKGSGKADTPPMPEFGQTSQERIMLQMLGQQIPNMKTQAQLTVFMAAFDALRLTLNGYFGNSFVAAEQARIALDQALDMSKQTTGITSKIREVENKSDTAKNFEVETLPPSNVHEYDNVKALMAGLGAISSLNDLNKWYAQNRSALDKIVDSKLRDQVFDAVRTKKQQLEVS